MGEFETWDDEAVGSDSKSNDTDAQDRQVTPKSSTHLALPNANASSTNGQSSSQPSVSDLESAISSMHLSDPANGIITIGAVPSTPQPLQSRNASTPAASSSVTQPVSINVQSANEAGLSPLYHNHTTNGLGADRGVECPMTPRNDAGPFVLDGSGSAGRAAGQSILRDRDDTESGSGMTTSITPGADGAPLLPPINVD